MFAFRTHNIIHFVKKKALGGENITLYKTVCSISLQHRIDDKIMFTLNKTKRFQYIRCHIYLELDTTFPKYKGQLSTRTTSVKQNRSNIVNGLID